MQRLLLVVFLGCLAALVQAQSSDEARFFSGQDVFNLEFASEPRVSPDGQQVMYRRKSNDIMTDSTRSSLWVVDLATGTHRPLLSDSRNYSWARWSPDGSRIAYVMVVDGMAQIKIHWLVSGRSALIASPAKKPSNLSWSPDNLSLAFTMPVPVQAESLVTPRKKPANANWAEPARLITSVRYQFDGLGIVAPESRQVFIVPADGGTPRQLSQGNFQRQGPLSWSRDSRRILFSANRHNNWSLETIESDLCLVEVKSQKLIQITDEPGAEFGARFSPDGSSILFLHETNEPVAYRHTRLRIHAIVDGTTQALLADVDYTIKSALRSDAGRTISFLFDQAGERKIGKVDWRNQFTQISHEVGGTSLGRPYLSGGFHYRNGTYAFTYAKAGRPADLAVTRGDGIRQMTF